MPFSRFIHSYNQIDYLSLLMIDLIFLMEKVKESIRISVLYVIAPNLDWPRACGFCTQ